MRRRHTRSGCAARTCQARAYAPALALTLALTRRVALAPALAPALTLTLADPFDYPTDPADNEGGK